VNVREAIEHIETTQRARAARAESADKFKKFYSSPVWKKARWRFMASQSKPLRCQACGRTSRETSLAVDHVVPLRRDWSRRLDPTNFQILCTPDCNFHGKGGRDACVWLSDEMVDRVAGLIVIAEHPNTNTGVLDGPEFFKRVIGVCLMGFVEADNLMAVVRIIDEGVCEILESGQFDTSPSVVVDTNNSHVLKVGDDTVLIEDAPLLWDHLAVLDLRDNLGVWSRGGTEPPGVEIDEKETAHA
jgi:hypothetical protein